jgi:hypothetical protein
MNTVGGLDRPYQTPIADGSISSFNPPLVSNVIPVQLGSAHSAAIQAMLSADLSSLVAVIDGFASLCGALK